MASQHSFPTGYPNAQQSVMRMTFGGGQMMPGLVAPQQTMLNSSQQFNPVQAPPDNLGMMNTQQVLSQQQQQQQQQQTNVASQQAVQVNGQVTPMSMPQVPQVPQKQPVREFNTASLCKLGQESVHEIVIRTQDLFQTLKIVQPPNGTAQGNIIANDRKLKVQDTIRMLNMLFKRLRIIYEKCNENNQLQGMEYTHIESLIPLKEEWEMKADEKKNSEAYNSILEESKETIEQVVLKNGELKELIDQLRRIVLEVNTMMSVRTS